MKLTRPAITSVSAGALPLNGTCSHLGAGERLEQRGGKVRRAAVAGGAVGDLAGLRLGGLTTSAALLKGESTWSTTPAAGGTPGSPA